MRKTFLLTFLAVASCALAQTRFSVLGDSYSTFKGVSAPEWADIWYDGETDVRYGGNDVTSADSTWWSMLDRTPQFALEKNNSWSGSTVCLTGYNGEDYSDRAFVTRTLNLGDPDVILVFGCTNDSWAGSPVGEYKYENWTRADLKAFRPAMACLMSRLTAEYPGARIYHILNTGLKPEINESVETICSHYGVPVIKLSGIDKIYGHPSVAGMRAIFEQVYSAINE